MPYLGGAAMTPMFDVLLDSTDRHVRRSAFDRLRQAGPLIARDAVARLTSDSRWYARRNLLALLAQLDELPSDFDAMRYLQDADARVRREALRVALRRSERRAERIADRARGPGLARALAGASCGARGLSAVDRVVAA